MMHPYIPCHAHCVADRKEQSPVYAGTLMKQKPRTAENASHGRNALASLSQPVTTEVHRMSRVCDTFELDLRAMPALECFRMPQMAHAVVTLAANLGSLCSQDGSEQMMYARHTTPHSATVQACVPVSRNAATGGSQIVLAANLEQLFHKTTCNKHRNPHWPKQWDPI